MACRPSPMPSTIINMASTVANMALTIVDLASSGESMAPTIANLASTIRAMASTIVTMSSSISTIPPVISDIASTIANMATTVTNIAINCSTMDSRFVTIASTMASMANTIVSISSPPHAISDDSTESSLVLDDPASRNIHSTRVTSSTETTTLQSTVSSTTPSTSRNTALSPTASALTSTTNYETMVDAANYSLPMTPNSPTSSKSQDSTNKTPNQTTSYISSPTLSPTASSQTTTTHKPTGLSLTKSTPVTHITTPETVSMPDLITTFIPVNPTVSITPSAPPNFKSSTSSSPITLSISTASVSTKPFTTNRSTPNITAKPNADISTLTTSAPTYPISTIITTSTSPVISTTPATLLTPTIHFAPTTTSSPTYYKTPTILSSSSSCTAPIASLWNGVRTIKILDQLGRLVLYDIFIWGTPKKSLTEPLDQYLAHLPQDSKANYFKMNSVQRRFNKTELQHISRDPSCASFDISLLWKCIKLVCENVEHFDDSCWHPVKAKPTLKANMECYVGAIKKYRNDIYHGTLEMTHSDFLQIAAELRHILVSALSAAKQKYSRTDAESAFKIQKVHDDIDKITQEVLGENDLMAFCGNRLSQDLIHDVNDVLKIQFRNAVNIDPIAFLTGTNLRLHVQKVFTEVKVRIGDRSKEGTIINYLDLLTVAKNCDENTSIMPQVLLVEGVAGSGKTTLLTMMMDEWLKPEHDRSVKGLDHYDLLLKVQCRDRAITTFKSLLEKHVSEVFLKYRNLVLPLIKKCNVLILIDGLDEANDDSEMLLNDIVEEMKGVPNCTLLCTTRPEKMSIFSNKIDSKFHISYMELLGIPESSREQFVSRYHEEIKRQINGIHDTESLVHKVRELGNKELFRLPLNLVFFTWIYHHNPSAITITTTQTQLYHLTHQLSVEKLLDRLVHHPFTKTRDRHTLENCAQSCLDCIYHESLLALIQDKLTLEKKAEDNIRVSCITQGLPPLELLSAFFSLKATRTYLGMQEQYSTPHKGMQEYYAALHVVHHSSMTGGSGSVREVLNITLGAQEIKLSMLQNVLQHVAGLLHLLNYNVPKAVSVEVVDLLQESGVRCRKQWLDLLEDTEAAPAVLHRVAQHFMISSDGDEIVITDGRVGSYIALLPHLPSQCPVRVNIAKNPEGLKEMLQILIRHTCMWLFLHHYYRDPSQELDFDDILQLLLPRSNMKVFLGQLSSEGVACLPTSLENLGLVFAGDEHCQPLLASLRAAHLPNLKHLKMHIPVDVVSPEVLTPLPGIDSAQLGEGVDLILSGVSDYSVEKAARVIAALMPPSGFRAITFPRTTATESGWRLLVQKLAADGVQVRAGIAVPDTTVTIDEKNELDHLAETTVGCDFWRITEEILWP